MSSIAKAGGRTAKPKASSLSTSKLTANIKSGLNGELLEQKFVVNPTIAQYILDKHNSRNRSINDTHLSSLVRDIKQGQWIEGTGTMVSFSQSGEMIDGQHRLAAIVKANTPLVLSFKFGLNDAAQRVIDTGRKRTYSDYIAMTEGHDAKYKMERASVTRLLYGFLNDQSRPHVFANNNKPTQSDLYEVSVEFGQAIADSAKAIFTSGHVPKVVIGSYAAFVHFLAKNTTHTDKADEFFELLGTGANMTADNPIMVVRNRLLTREEFRSQKTKDRTIGLLVKGWNHWVKGDLVTNKMHTPDHVVRMEGLSSLGKHPLYVP